MSELPQIVNFSASYECEKNCNQTALLSIQQKTQALPSRKLVYASTITVLYSLFEQFVEEIIASYVKSFEKAIPTFSQLPKHFQDSHTVLSAQLILNCKLDKYRDRCSPENIISQMQQCLGHEEYALNELAYTDHKSNFRCETLNQLFSAVGIKSLLSRIKASKLFSELLGSHLPEGNPEQLSESIIFADLDDLVWRRNVVAHGWPDDILSPELILQRIRFVEVLGQLIHQIARQDQLKELNPFLNTPLPRPLKVYGNSIVCFNFTSCKIKKGEQIFAKRPCGSFLEGNIEEIQVNGLQIDEVIAPPAIDVAFRVTFPTKENMEFYLPKSILR